MRSKNIEFLKNIFQCLKVLQNYLDVVCLKVKDEMIEKVHQFTFNLNVLDIFSRQRT